MSPTPFLGELFYRNELGAPDFATHDKYIEHFVRTSDRLRAEVRLSLLGDKNNARYLAKAKLITLTKQSIQNEMSIIEADDSYGEPSAAWLPVKTYYLMHHHICLLAYLITGDEGKLRFGHVESLVWFATFVGTGKLVYSSPFYNTVKDKSILEFKSTSSGSHLSHSCPEEEISSLILKKAFKERMAEIKRGRKLNLRLRKDKSKYEGLEGQMNVDWMDYLYQFRIRVNYCNLDFLDDISPAASAAYSKKWCLTAICLSDAMEPITLP